MKQEVIRYESNYTIGITEVSVYLSRVAGNGKYVLKCNKDKK